MDKTAKDALDACARLEKHLPDLAELLDLAEAVADGAGLCPCYQCTRLRRIGELAKKLKED